VAGWLKVIAGASHRRDPVGNRAGPPIAGAFQHLTEFTIWALIDHVLGGGAKAACQRAGTEMANEYEDRKRNGRPCSRTQTHSRCQIRSAERFPA
jgi:hypothetical protein